MIAMQYSFTLPADYDMSIIDQWSGVGHRQKRQDSRPAAFTP